MPRQSDHSDGPSTLPTPELNPLVNPVLGRNMGRWAEVYFTNPPEKREQAVLELLHELEVGNSLGKDDAPPALQEDASRLAAPGSRSAENQPTRVRCHACGQESPASQRFCGRCGLRLEREGSSTDLLDEPAANQDRGDEPTLSVGESSLFRSSRGLDSIDDHLGWTLDSAPASRSYRVYVGAALAIVILALAYIAWRGAQATSQSAHVEPQAPPMDGAATSQPAATSPNANTAKRDTPERTPSASNEPTVSPDDAAKPAGPVRSEASTKPDPDKGAPAAPLAPAASENNPQLQGLSGNGSEELAIAQNYLNGANGQARNSAEAAGWLWKAIAKHNAAATLLLSDLYLKGDGVPKNCDQARVLLDAAASKGMKDAGERLRHLQAFGCQ